MIVFKCIHSPYLLFTLNCLSMCSSVSLGLVICEAAGHVFETGLKIVKHLQHIIHLIEINETIKQKHQIYLEVKYESNLKKVV